MPRVRLAPVLLALLVAAGGCATTTSPEPTFVSPAPTTTAGADAPVVHTSAVPALHPSVDGYPSADVELVAGDGTVHRLAVRQAVTLEQRQHGLMEVPDVPAGTGMLFAYAEDRDGAFTMRGTLTPLQIAWVDAGGTVVAMADMVPCDDEPCPVWEPGVTYRTALEVRAGWFDTIGFGIGDSLTVLTDG